MRERFPSLPGGTSREHSHYNYSYAFPVSIEFRWAIMRRMKKPSNRLEKDLVRAAYDHYSKRPWNAIASEALFLVRVPTEDLPLVASIMGGAREQYGLILARGENAMKLFVQFVLDHPGAEEFGQIADLLSVSFDAWGSVADSYRLLLERAGQVPRQEKVVPVIFHSPPHREAHPPGRADMRTLHLVLSGINAALQDGQLGPVPLNPGNHRILELDLQATGRRVSYTIREVDWPESSMEVPALLMLPLGLQDLPRLPQRWLFARLVLPGPIDDDDRLAYVLILAVETGPVLGVRIARGVDMSEAADLVSEAMEGQAPTKEVAGLPSAILFNDHWLHGALAPALAGLGIQTAVDPDSEAMEDLMESVSDGLPAPEVKHEPDSLSDWKAAERETCGLLSSEILGKNLLTDRALKRHFGDVESGERLLRESRDLPVLAALIEWFAADYRATSRSKTVIEKFLAKRSGLSPEIRSLLEARRASRLSVYRVVSTEPGLSLEVEDIFDGECFTVYDRGLAGSGVEGYFLPLRLIQAGRFTFPLVAGPPLSGYQAISVLDSLVGPDTDCGWMHFREVPEIIGHLWTWTLEMRPPVLQNTDGDPLELQSASFVVHNVSALIARLEERSDLEFDLDESVWTWMGEGAEGAMGSPVVLARLTLLDDRLLVEVNSVKRLERTRAWLEESGAVSFESVTASSLDIGQAPLDDRLPQPPAEPPTAEMAEMVKSLMLERYKRWVDEPIPMLRNLTPRQACKSAQGKRKVLQLIRTMPPIQTPSGPIDPPRAEILAELGIDGGGHSSAS